MVIAILSISFTCFSIHTTCFGLMWLSRDILYCEWHLQVVLTLMTITSIMSQYVAICFTLSTHYQGKHQLKLSEVWKPKVSYDVFKIEADKCFSFRKTTINALRGSDVGFVIRHFCFVVNDGGRKCPLEVECLIFCTKSTYKICGFLVQL